MIQDIFPDHLDNHYRTQEKPAPGSTVFCMEPGRVLVRISNGTVQFPTYDSLPEHTAVRYLFAIGEQTYFLYCGQIDLNGYAYEEIRSVRQKGIHPKKEVFALLTAKHLFDWYRDNHFCGRCGEHMQHALDERAMYCPACNNRVYPRIMPAVIVAVTAGDRLLVTKYAQGYRYFALVAGFTEIGETLEETVEREVMEEVGLHVKNIRYYKSQPWGMANDILMGFVCEVDGDETIHMDTGELGFAQFVERDEIELQPDDFSLTNEMMYRFKEGML